MLYRKYNQLKRSNIVICSPLLENNDNFDIDNSADAEAVLNQLYVSELDLAPYNYIVHNNGYFEYKYPDIYNMSLSFESAFDEDIKIFLCKNIFLTSKIDAISSLIAELSIMYSMTISESVIFVGPEMDNVLTKAKINNIIAQAILKRNALRPEFAIVETYINNSVILNEKITMTNNRCSYLTIKDFADRYLLPETTLTSLNPHINASSLKITDTIFLPRTVSVDTAVRALNCKKQAQYSYDKINYLLGEGGSANG